MYDDGFLHGARINADKAAAASKPPKAEPMLLLAAFSKIFADTDCAPGEAATRLVAGSDVGLDSCTSSLFTVDLTIVVDAAEDVVRDGVRELDEVVGDVELVVPKEE